MADGLGRVNGKYNNLFVAKALASSVKTLLGPQHSLKCCTSDGEAVICSSTSKLLQFIDIQHPAGFVINDACQGQYKKYRTNCKTLVCLAGFWSSAVQDLQDQGVPVPVIVRLFDDALEVCEEVCQAMSIPVIEALQSLHNSYTPAQDYDVTAVEEANSSTVESSCCHNAGSDMLEEVDVIGDDDDDDDISWYFDGHILGVDGQIPGVDSHFPGVDDHIPGVDGHIPGNYGYFLGADSPILGNDSHILGEDGNIPGVCGYITGADDHTLGEINMEMMNKSAMECPRSDLPEVNSYPEIIRDRCTTNSNKNPGNILLGAEHSKFAVGMGDANVTVRSISYPWVNTTKPGAIPNVTNKSLLSVEQKDSDLTLDSVSEEGTSDREHNSNTLLESLESASEVLLSGQEDEDEYKDEFEASFAEVVSNSTQENLGSKIAEFSIAKDRKDIFLSRDGAKIFADAQEKTDGTKFVESKTMKKTLVNPLLTSSSGSKEKELNDKLFSLLSEKLESKNKVVGRQVKLSEIFKGSRHFMKNSTDEPFSETTSAIIEKQPKDISLNEKRHEKSETCPTGKTSLQSMLETGHTGKPDLVNSTPCNRKTIPAQSKDRSLFFLQTKDKLTLLERNKQLLTKLGSRLSHGKEDEMKLAIEVINFLFLSSGKTSLEDFEIHLRMIHTELVLGPPGSFSQIIDGLLLESTALYQTATVNRNTVTESQLLIAALVDGDVTSEFRHAGLNKEIHIHRIIENKEDFKASIFNPEKDWYQRVTKTLRNYKIGLLVVKGIVQDSVLDYCSSHGIVVLQSVTYPTVQLLSFATDSTIVTYLADLREQDIGRPVTIETWELGWAPSLVRQSKSQFTGMKSCQYVLVKDVKREIADCTDMNSPLQTVLLCSPCKDILCDMEERFWNSIYRLKNALACGRVLPGAGKIELACIRRLNESAGELSEPTVSRNPLSGWLQESLELFRPLVYTAFAQGFKEFLKNVLQNSGKFTSPCGVSAHVEQLVNSGSSLEILERFQDEKDNQYELQITEEITRHHAIDHVPNIPARDPAGFSVNSSGDPVGSKLLSRDVESVVWDDYTAKKEAWRRAVGLVRILLQSDMLVETGLGRNDKEAVLF